LTVNELRHALAVEWAAGEDQPHDLEEGNLLESDSLADVCAGLVIIENESQIVRLVHFTTEEFFRSSPEALFPDADTQISKTCLTYLSFDTFGEGPCHSDKEFEARIQHFPFLSYAANYWGYHLRRQPERELQTMALLFLNTKANLLASIQVMGIQSGGWKSRVILAYVHGCLEPLVGRSPSL